MNHYRINWPAFIKYAGADELALVTDDAVWRREYRQSACDPADFLVDSDGHLFALQGNSGEGIAPLPRHQHIDPEAIGQLLRNHFAAIGECCIARLPAMPAAEALRLLQETDEHQESKT